jgi:hypothetical protein
MPTPMRKSRLVLLGAVLVLSSVVAATAYALTAKSFSTNARRSATCA